MSLVHTTITHFQRDQIEIMQVENQHARLQISLFAGHILSFIPKHDGRERLWISDKAKYDGFTPIRGGIPICWPWFGAAPEQLATRFGALPSHGIVRTCDWQVSDLIETPEETQITLSPNIAKTFNDLTSLSIELHIVVGKQLSVSIKTTNPSREPVPFFAALHSYFAVRDINQTEIIGIQRDYADKLKAGSIHPAPSPYKISEEVDRVHLGESPQISIAFQGSVTSVQSTGSDSIVVWNPWQRRSNEIADMLDDGYKTMLCIETARTQPNMLPPATTHTLTQTIG